MKSLMNTGILAVSLALIGTTAMAAPSPANPVPRYAQTYTQTPMRAWQAGAPLRFAAQRPFLRGRLNGDVAQFVRGVLGGGPIPYANLVRDVRGLRGSSGGSYDWSSSPSYDNSAAASSAASDAQAASDAEVQAIQQMNDTNALNASMAAAEQQNDAANAATLQTEINAGM